MKQYAVIHGVCGIWEGYSETDCEFFPNRGFAEKHALQLLKDFEQDSMVLQIDHPDDDTWYYHMDHEGDGDLETATQCIITIITLDMSNRDDNTESCWLTWDQLDNCQAWDYTPLCMSLVTRVSSDVHDKSYGNPDAMDYSFTQLNEFISSVYYRGHAIIDVDDYVMHAFRIPKPKNSESYDEETTH